MNPCIPSPSLSVKIQIMGGKVCLRCKGKTLLGVVKKHLKTKSLLTSPSNVLPFHFPVDNLNCHWRWRWWDRIQAIFLNLFYFTQYSVKLRNIGEIGDSFCVKSWARYLNGKQHEQYSRSNSMFSVQSFLHYCTRKS